MGQRTIDTILRVQNESGYKAALKNCSSELKVMKSELDKVTSDFRNNANSMEALTRKGEVLSKMYSAQQQKVDGVAEIRHTLHTEQILVASALVGQEKEGRADQPDDLYEHGMIPHKFLRCALV